MLARVYLVDSRLGFVVGFNFIMCVGMYATFP